MEPSKPGATRAITFALNGLFLLGSVVLLALTIFAAVDPPRADIAPLRVNFYPAFIITIGLIATFGLAVFFLSTLGFLATCMNNSFLLSVHIIAQLGLISAQFVAIAFTLTVRTRLHYRLEELWRGKDTCPSIGRCVPVERFQKSETILIIGMCCGFFLQVCLLISSTILCERISYQERYQAQLLKEKEEDDD